MTAADGHSLGGLMWRHENADRSRPVVVITAATSVRCRYYSRFAEFLYGHGYDVLTYDYRGIGESRPASLRGFKADWIDWGEHDLEAAFRFAATEFPGQPIDVVAHSIGGFNIGTAPSNGVIRRIVTVGAQFAYWGDYAQRYRRRMYVKWHIFMPLLTMLFGYFPGKRLGWLEDTPAGVVRDWSRMRPRFEDTVRPGRFIGDEPEGRVIMRRFETVRAPILAISLQDDPHGTVEAIERLLDYFTGTERTHLRIAPDHIGHETIGHFAFFHDRFKGTLWPLVLGWLEDARLPDGAPGDIVSSVAAPVAAAASPDEARASA